MSNPTGDAMKWSELRQQISPEARERMHERKEAALRALVDRLKEQATRHGHDADFRAAHGDGTTATIQRQKGATYYNCARMLENALDGSE